MLHCITVPSKTSEVGTAIIWSSIRDMSAANTIRAFLNTRGEGRPWEYWQQLGYECAALRAISYIILKKLSEDWIELSFPNTTEKPVLEVTVSGTQQSSEVVPDGTVCVLGIGTPQHLPQTQEEPPQAVDG